MDDFVLNVRQIIQYPRKTKLDPTDVVLLQESDSTGIAAGAYKSALVTDFISTALATTGVIRLSPEHGGIAFNGAVMSFAGGDFTFSDAISAPGMFIDGISVATEDWVTTQLDATNDVITHILHNSVHSFEGRTGDVVLQADDILRGGGVLQVDPHFHGHCTATSHWDVTLHDDTIATTNWVHRAICWDLEQLLRKQVVTTFDGRFGAVKLEIADVNKAYGVTSDFPAAPTPPVGDNTERIANTQFVTTAVEAAKQTVIIQFEGDVQAVLDIMNMNFAPLSSPQFINIPAAPTAPFGTNTGQLATTAFVQQAIVASTAGVASFNNRTGAITLTAADLNDAGGALLASPTFTGTPLAPSPALGTNSNQIATCAWVLGEIASGVAGVASFNTRTGAVTLSAADVVGTGVLNNTALAGVPTAATATAGTSTTQLATTAFVAAAIAAMPSGGVSSFNTRTGAVTLTPADISAAGGAVIASPTFTGTPAGPTAAPGTNTTQLATTAFVAAAISAAAVASFNGRTGAVTLTTQDITGAGGAVLVSPAFTGTPTAPTATPGTNTTQLATTQFVTSAVSAGLANPAFTGTPTAPTASPGTNTTQLATTAFVMAALAAAGGVASFNGRSGTVVLQANDVSAVGAAMTVSPTFTGIPQAPTPAPTDNGTTIATTAFVKNAVAAGALPSGAQDGQLLGWLGGLPTWFGKATQLRAGFSSFNYLLNVFGADPVTTLAIEGGNIQVGVFGAASGTWTLSPHSNSGTIIVEVWNVRGLALSPSGWTKVSGDTWTTSTSGKWLLFCTKTENYSHLFIQNLTA